MVTWKIKSCPRCGGDMFLDIEKSTYFDHCLQCGYLAEKQEPEEQEHRHEAGVVTGSGDVISDWVHYGAGEAKPGRPKGSKDKKKRRRKGEASHRSPMHIDSHDGGDSVYPR